MIELKEAIRNMNPRSELFKVIKEELEALGRWKKLPRGIAGFKTSVKKENKNG